MDNCTGMDTRNILSEQCILCIGSGEERIAKFPEVVWEEREEKFTEKTIVKGFERELVH